jgi:hypothetical protein
MLASARCIRDGKEAEEGRRLTARCPQRPRKHCASNLARSALETKCAHVARNAHLIVEAGHVGLADDNYVLVLGDADRHDGAEVCELRGAQLDGLGAVGVGGQELGGHGVGEGVRGGGGCGGGGRGHGEGGDGSQEDEEGSELHDCCWVGCLGGKVVSE